MALLLAACSEAGDSLGSTTTSGEAARIAALERQLRTAEDELEELTANVEELEAELAELATERDGLEREVEDSRERVANLTDERDWWLSEFDRVTVELEQLRELASLPPEASAAVVVLRQYFQAVSTGDYTTAVALYGGDYEDMIGSNPTVDPSDHVALFRDACAYQLQCQLRIGRILPGQYTAPSLFEFHLELRTPEGDIFTLEGCCGDDSGEVVRLFRFTVADEGDGLRVMTRPVYMP
jgi:hypothetical protein